MLCTARRLAAASFCFLSFAAPAFAADPIGTVIATSGSATASGRALSEGSPVYEDDRLVTVGGNVQIMFIDRTKLLVGPGSTLVIERFLLRGGRSVRKFSIDALRGTFRFISGNSRKVAYDIRTANATIGVHGTAFDVSTGSGTLVAVYSGEVGLCAYGKCATVEQYCGVARARGDDVVELSGRAKARALRSLPFVSQQGRLAPRFRVDTSGCQAFLVEYGTGPQRDNDFEAEGGSRRPDPRPNPNPQ
jgi:hypothetical protein